MFKIDRSRPIDAAVAMALAYWRASVGSSNVYESRGLLVV